MRWAETPAMSADRSQAWRASAASQSAEQAAIWSAVLAVASTSTFASGRCQLLSAISLFGRRSKESGCGAFAMLLGSVFWKTSAPAALRLVRKALRVPPPW